MDGFEKAILAVVICIISLPIILGIDRCSLKEREIQVQLLGRSYKPAWTQTIMMQSGKVMVPQIIHHAESWTVSVAIEEEIITYKCSEEFYKKFNKYADAYAMVSTGRLSGNTICKEIFYLNL